MFLDYLLDFIFPPKCVGCKKNVESEEVLCSECFASLKINQTLFCGKCRARLPNSVKICHRDFPYILGAATNYDGEIIKNTIHALKFRSVKSVAQPLAEILIKYADSLDLSFKNFSIIPIPLSRNRLRKRGFNQSELISKIFSENFGLALETDVLIRSKHTKPQSETRSLAERKENVTLCFAVNGGLNITNKNIILIDDVTTSGATLLEAAKILKSAGAKKIVALTVAKA